MQHRFTVILYLLSFPFLGFYFNDRVKKNAFIMALVFSVFAYVPAFFYSSRGAEPIPRLRNKEAAVLADIIAQNKTPESGLIVDFYDWESTYYVAFMSGLPKSNIVIIDQSSSDDVIKTEIKNLLDRHPKGFMLYYDKGKLPNEAYISGDTLRFNNIHITLIIKSLYDKEGVGLYGYRWE
ncbi:MAG: hypothetical protein BWY70_01554 [Bacteroidetes bacterium ADurb.Bin408]|nr:MAG: hypothetical protein BWY70_01554 [Bacteroidetes bacterium ADurb.Bin408]